MPDNYFLPILAAQGNQNEALLRIGLQERQAQQARDIEQMRQEAETERFRQQAQTYFDRLEQQGQNQIRLQAAKDEADEVQRLNIYARGVGVGPYQTGESKDEFTQRVNKAAGELIGRYQKQSSRLAVDMPRKLKEARALTPEQELQAAKAGLLVLQQNPATAKLSSGPIAPQTTKGIQELIGTLSSSASREVSAAATSASMAMLEKSSEIAASKPEAQEQAEMFKMMMEDYRSSIANAQALRTHYPGGIQFIPEPVLPPAPPRAVEKAKGEGATAQAEPKREFGIGGTPTASSSIPMAIAGKMFSDAVRTPGQDAIAERAVRLGMSPEAAAGVSAAAESMPSMPLGPVTSMNPVSTQSGYAFGSGLVPKVLEYAAKTIPYGAKVFAAPYNPYLNPTEDTQALLQYALPALFQARSAGQAIGPGAAAVGDWLPAIASTVMGLRGFGGAPRGAAMPSTPMTAMPRVVSSGTQPWMRDWMAVAPEQQVAAESASAPAWMRDWMSISPRQQVAAEAAIPGWPGSPYTSFRVAPTPALPQGSAILLEPASGAMSMNTPPISMNSLGPVLDYEQGIASQVSMLPRVLPNSSPPMFGWQSVGPASAERFAVTPRLVPSGWSAIAPGEGIGYYPGWTSVGPEPVGSVLGAVPAGWRAVGPAGVEKLSTVGEMLSPYYDAISGVRAPQSLPSYYQRWGVGY